MSTETEQAYQLTEEERRQVDEITERRGRLVAALLAATTALDDAVVQIGQLRSGSVYDIELAEDWKMVQLPTGALIYLDALAAAVGRAIGGTAKPENRADAARARAEDRGLSSYLDALANAVPLLSPGALAVRPLA